jgi:glutamyl-tRNA synthetase
MTFMVRTRFAPSPTGFLHIGGVRTALYNWLYARHHGGQFILRIDDTDTQRNVAEALQPILDGFRWLGIDWDEGAEVGGPYGPYYQSQKQERYRQAVQQLLDKGLAYWDYSTKDEMDAERKAAEVKKEPFLYSRRWMARTPAERAAFEAQGREGAVRLLMPREGSCRFYDHVRGDVEVEWIREADHVIQRADGSCLYNLASVVDDEEMKITHVIRAVEHLSNTPRQIFIAQGLGYKLPDYAHIPFVCEPGSKVKLSKRKLEQYLSNTSEKFKEFREIYAHARDIACAIGLETRPETFNPVIVEFYQKVGYLPDALLNYLLLVGWSLDDKTEMFNRCEMMYHFSLKRVNSDPGSFDAGKLLHFQGEYMNALPQEQKAEMALPYLQKAGLVGTPPSEAEKDLLRSVLLHAAHRFVVAGDILDYAPFFVADAALTWDDKAFEKHLRKPAGAAGHLAALRQRLAGLEPFDPPTLEANVKDYIQATGAKLGAVNQALRVATTGKDVGFGTYETLAVLGRARCLARIDRVLLILERG